MSELYISTDVETDGPIPGVYSMLSLGSAAFLGGRLIDTFSANLERMDGAIQDPDTMRWWASQPEAKAAVEKNRRPPKEAMTHYYEWLRKLENQHALRVVFVGYPAGFDFMFTYWYLIRFAGKSPFSFSAIDMKSYAMAKLGTDYRRSTKWAWPEEWKDAARKAGAVHTHVALDDAIEQGYAFLAMLRGGQS